jgi:hypothetical protein
MKKIFLLILMMVITILGASLKYEYNSNTIDINTNQRETELPDLQYHNNNPIYLWYNTAPEENHYWAQEFVIDDFFGNFASGIADSVREEKFTLKRVRFYSLFVSPGIKFNFYIDANADLAKNNVNLLPDHSETINVQEGWNEILVNENLVGTKFFVSAKIITNHVGEYYIAGTDGTGNRSYYYRNIGGSSANPQYQYCKLGDYGFNSDFVFDAYGDYSLKSGDQDIPVVVIKDFQIGSNFAPGNDYNPTVTVKNHSESSSLATKIFFKLISGTGFSNTDNLPLQVIDSYGIEEFNGFETNTYTIPEEDATYQLSVYVNPQDTLSKEVNNIEYKTIFSEEMKYHMVENFFISSDNEHIDFLDHENSILDTSTVILNYYPTQSDEKFAQAAISRFSFYEFFSFPNVVVNGAEKLKNKQVTNANITDATDSLTNFKSFITFERDSLQAAYGESGTSIRAKIPLKAKTENILSNYYEKTSFHAVLTERDSVNGEFVGNHVIHQFTLPEGIEGIGLDTLNTYFEFNINPLGIDFNNATVNTMAEKTDIWFWYQADDQILYLDKVNYSDFVALANDPIKIVNISAKLIDMTYVNPSDTTDITINKGYLLGAAIERDAQHDYSSLKIHFDLKMKSDPSFSESKTVTVSPLFEGSNKFIVVDSLFAFAFNHENPSELRLESYLEWETDDGNNGESAFNSVYFYTINGKEHKKILIDLMANLPFENISQMNAARSLQSEYDNLDLQALFLGNSVIDDSQAEDRINFLGLSSINLPGIRINGDFTAKSPNYEELKSYVENGLNRTTFVEEDAIEVTVTDNGLLNVKLLLKNDEVPVYEEHLRQLKLQAAVTIDTTAYGNVIPEYYMNLLPEGISVEYLNINTEQEFEFQIDTDIIGYNLGMLDPQLDPIARVHFWLENSENRFL